MSKREKVYEKHEDLIKFEKKYTKRINEFIKEDPETRIVFLNADFGWGKTTFIENNLKIKENNIFSPWLNKSDNYLEDIYYHVNKKNKGKSSSCALFLSLLFAICTVIFGGYVSILTELNKSDKMICFVRKFKLICTTNDNLNSLLIYMSLFVALIIVVSFILIFMKPVPIVNFFKRDNGKYYEDKLINVIIKKVNKALVIEDIDRAEDIEEILIVANKISKYIKDKKLDKYILITGDYIRMIRRIGNPDIYENNSMDLSNNRDKGMFLTEKIVSLRIDFSSISERIKNLLKESNLSTNLTNIEYDEIIAFVKNKYLSIRFFTRFLKKYKKEISEGNSLYHLLLKYFQEEKYFNINDDAINNSIYNINRFPTCINDIEMMYQKRTIKINNKNYSTIELFNERDSNYNIINNAFRNLFDKKDLDSISVFKEFYLNDKFPVLEEDKKKISYNKMINIGSALKPNNLKGDLDNYLLGGNNTELGYHEGILLNKRCYFNSKNSTYNFENYKINSVDIIYSQDVSNDNFIYAYIACFFRENKDEIKKNYPELEKRINDIIKY